MRRGFATHGPAVLITGHIRVAVVDLRKPSAKYRQMYPNN